MRVSVSRSLLVGAAWLFVGALGLGVVLAFVTVDTNSFKMFTDTHFVRLIAIAMGPPMLLQVIGGTVATVRCTRATRLGCYVVAMRGGFVATACYAVFSFLCAVLATSSHAAWVGAGALSLAFFIVWWWVFVATCVLGGAVAVECHRWLTST